MVIMCSHCAGMVHMRTTVREPITPERRAGIRIAADANEIMKRSRTGTSDIETGGTKGGLASCVATDLMLWHLHDTVHDAVHEVYDALLDQARCDCNVLFCAVPLACGQPDGLAQTPAAANDSADIAHYAEIIRVSLVQSRSNASAADLVHLRCRCLTQNHQDTA